MPPGSSSIGAQVLAVADMLKRRPARRGRALGRRARRRRQRHRVLDLARRQQCGRPRRVRPNRSEDIVPPSPTGPPAGRIRRPRDGVPHLRQGQLRPGDGRHQARRASATSSSIPTRRTERRVADDSRQPTLDGACGRRRRLRRRLSRMPCARRRRRRALLVLLRSGGVAARGGACSTPTASPRRRWPPARAPGAAHGLRRRAGRRAARSRTQPRSVAHAPGWQRARPPPARLARSRLPGLLRRSRAVRRWRCSSPATRRCCGIRRWRWSAAARRAPAAATTRASSPARWRRPGWRVTSGLAAGIDTAAHWARWRPAGRTVAVLGTGPDVPIRAAMPPCIARIAAAGARGQRTSAGHAGRRQHFPQRNRIIAGLGARHAGGRGRAALGRADHRAPGRRGRARGVRAARARSTTRWPAAATG